MLQEKETFSLFSTYGKEGRRKGFGKEMQRACLLRLTIGDTVHGGAQWVSIYGNLWSYLMSTYLVG